MCFQNVCAAMVQNKVAVAAAMVAAVALLEGGPLNTFEFDIALILWQRCKRERHGFRQARTLSAGVRLNRYAECSITV